MKKLLGYTLVSLLGLLVLSEPAMAQGIKTITNNAKDQLPGIAEVASIVSYILGVIFGIKAGLKLKESNESKGQVPMSNSIVLGIVAGIFLALPTFLTTNKEAVFGAGSQGTTLDGSSIRVIR